MKKFMLFCGTVAILALASCSNDETVSSSPVNPDEITFNVVSNNASRAADLYSASAKPEYFYVLAAHTGTQQIYMSIDKAVLDGDKYKFANGTHYWPAGDMSSTSTALDFYAFKGMYNMNTDASLTEITVGGAIGDGSTDNGRIKYSSIGIPKQAADQHDLLYAATHNAQKTADGTVNLTFRHGLAQLAFKLKNESRNLYVQVQKVELCNVSTKGKFIFGTNATYGSTYISGTGQYVAGAVDAITSSSDTYTSSTDCSWTASTATADIASEANTAQSLETATSGVSSYPLLTTSDVVNPQTVDIADAATHNDVMFVIPQLMNSLDATQNKPASGSGTTVADWANGTTYFIIYAKIQNVETPSSRTTADPTAASVTPGEYLAGSASDWKKIAIPVKQGAAATDAWEAGKKYTYTFVFGTDGNGNNGNGGIDYDDPGSPVLVPINIQSSAVNVDDYADADGGETYMQY